MRLQLQTPPTLVAVAVDDGIRPALLLGTRGDRSYVQVSRGAGLNHLRWVAASALRSAAAADAPPEPPGRSALPWVLARHDR